jgi:DNA-binding LacI/PurR family transcriptional regulator
VRERVLAAAGDLGYRGPDPKGRLLRAGKVNAIGVATAEPLAYFFEDPFARTLMGAIAEACDAEGAGLSLVSAANPETVAWNVDSALVDGFLLFCLHGAHRLVELTRARGLPFVAFELGDLDASVPAVGIDNRAGARLAGDHVGALGHRAAAILAISLVDDRHGPVGEAEIEAAVYRSTRERILGYREGLAAHGLDPRAVPVFETQNDAATVLPSLETLFASPQPPTALLCMSDRVALIALDWLTARGLSVPGDVSLVGFDGIPEGAASSPPLTTVVQPIARLGRRAVEILRLPGPEVRREMLPLALEIRASTAPPRRAGR